MKPVEHALLYAERGWRVFPVHHRPTGGRTPGRPGTPHLKGWPTRATTKPDRIKQWWTKWPDAWTGIATGAESGLLVVDLDVKNGKDGVATWAALNADLPMPDMGPRVQTKSGGMHIYFDPQGVNYGNSAGKLGPGIDVRGKGGMVVAPPGKGHAWETGTLELAVPPVPPWLAGLLTEARERPHRSGGHALRLPTEGRIPRPDARTAIRARRNAYLLGEDLAKMRDGDGRKLKLNDRLFAYAANEAEHPSDLKVCTRHALIACRKNGLVTELGEDECRMRIVRALCDGWAQAEAEHALKETSP